MKSFVQKHTRFMSRLHGSICRQHIESLFLYHASPVLRKAKPAVLITIKSDCMSLWKSSEKAMCKASGLYITELNRKNGSSIFLIYDKVEIKKSLSSKTSANILSKYGYGEQLNIEDLIRHLILRFQADDFPHEIGLFLGYPPGDVKAYIENKGRNCACCHYWKVYGDVETARKIWARIDEAQSHAIDVLQHLPPMHVAVNLLKAV